MVCGISSMVAQAVRLLPHDDGYPVHQSNYGTATSPMLCSAFFSISACRLNHCGLQRLFLNLIKDPAQSLQAAKNQAE
jgi:hypothetical protein